MMHREFGNRRHKQWSEWSVGAKVLAIAGGIVLIPGVLCQAKFPEKTAWPSGKHRQEFPTFTADNPL